MIPMTRPEVIEAAKTWTVKDLEQIALSIVALGAAGDTGNPEVAAALAVFKQRYAELAGKPFDLAYDRLFYETDGNA